MILFINDRAMTCSETFPGFNQELQAGDVTIAIQRICKVDVSHAPLAGTRISEPQANTDVPLNSVLAGCEPVAPGFAGVEEDCSANANETKRVPVREESLFQ